MLSLLKPQKSRSTTGRLTGIRIPFGTLPNHEERLIDLSNIEGRSLIILERSSGDRDRANNFADEMAEHQHVFEYMNVQHVFYVSKNYNSLETSNVGTVNLQFLRDDAENLIGFFDEAGETLAAHNAIIINDGFIVFHGSSDSSRSVVLAKVFQHFLDNLDEQFFYKDQFSQPDHGWLDHGARVGGELRIILYAIFASIITLLLIGVIGIDRKFSFSIFCLSLIPFILYSNNYYDIQKFLHARISVTNKGTKIRRNLCPWHMLQYVEIKQFQTFNIFSVTGRNYYRSIRLSDRDYGLPILDRIALRINIMKKIHDYVDEVEMNTRSVRR